MKSGKLTTKIISLFLCALMIFSLVPLGAVSAFAQAVTIPEGYTPIYDIEDLYSVRYGLNGNYILMADIDMTEATAEGGEWDSGSGWAPIGETSSAPFTGIFNGNGHSITGMRIKNTSVTYVGLFGYISGGTVKNLRMVNADIQDSSVRYAGTIAGCAYSATFENIAVDNLVMKVDDDTSSSEANDYGGIAGRTTGTNSAKTTISKSYVSGTITATGYNATYVGGMVGNVTSNTNISDCYNTATITANGSSYSNALAGGISGYYGTITNCINVGTVSGSRVYIGAINYYGATLSGCYYKQGTASSGKYNVTDGLATVNSLTEEQMKLQSVYGYLDFENTWVLDVASGAAYPQLKDNRQFAESGVRPSEDEHDDVIPEGYTPIYDIEDLYAVRYDLDGNYILMADIDMTEDTAADGDWSYDDDGWRPIGPDNSLPFSGIFDGNGHEITGMRIKNTPVTYVGLFGYINGGTVKNLRMVNADIQDSSVRYAGTIAGYANSATFENIAVDNLVMKVDDDTSSSEANDYGGIVGRTSGENSAKTTISKSYVSGTITATGYNATYVGGMVGNVTSNTNISDCYNTATITANGSSYSNALAGGISGYYGTITNCINVGTVSGSRAYIGAINYYGATLSHCYYKKGTASSGKYNTSDTAATAVALTEAQMKLQSVYGYLDFDNTWFLDTNTGKNYPMLQSCPEKTAESIVISSYPAKTSYLQHEELDVTGLKITVNYAHITAPSVIDVTVGMVSGYDATVIGTQTLTVTYLGKTTTFDVVVAPRPVTSVALDKTEVNLEVAMTQQLTATVLPDNATDKTLTWASDDEAVVTVDNTGLVTAQGTGTATVTVTASNGVSASAEITVLADHTYGDTVTTITATCFAAGSAYKTCSVCGHVENITLPIDSTNHSGGTEVRNAVAGNCGEAGYTGDTYCLGCNTMTAEGEVIPATENHNYTSEITTPSTCSVAGVRTYTCTVCEYSYTEAVELDPDNHTYGEIEVIEEATCTEDGYKARRCTGCDAVELGTETLPASTYPESAHNYSNNTDRTYNFSYPGAIKLHLTFSTSTKFESGWDYLYIYKADGSLYGKYSGTELSGRTITLDGSSFRLRLTSDGSNTHYGFSFTRIVAEAGEREVIPATGHDYAEVITTPVTCEEDGVKTFTCSNCGDVYTEEIPSTGHEYTSEITTESTCAVAGVRTYTCSVCSDTYTEELALSTEHTWGEFEVIEEATCTEDGFKTRRCSECGLATELIPSSTYPESAHNYSNYTDRSYNFSYSGATKLQLTFSTSTKFESGYDYLYIYNADGSLYGKYSGTELSGRTITLDGSSFRLRLTSDGSNTYYGFSFTRIVALAGESDIIPATGHDYVDIIHTPVTCTEDGVTTHTCSVCDYSYTEDVPAPGHTEEILPAVTSTCTATGLTEGKKCSVCEEILVPQEEVPMRHRDENRDSFCDYCMLPSLVELELVFVIDTTGSMSDDIYSVKTKMHDILESLNEQDISYRIAIIDYRDFASRTEDEDDYPYQVQLDFSEESEEIVDAINALSLGNGGDTEETVYSALIDGLKELDWSASSTKCAIIMGDAAPLDPEPYTGYTLYDAIRALKGISSTTVYDPDAASTFDTYALRSGTEYSETSEVEPVFEGDNIYLYSVTTSRSYPLSEFAELSEATGAEAYSGSSADAGIMIEAIVSNITEDVHIHTYSDETEVVVSEATCTEDGVLAHIIVCTECGQELSRVTEAIPAISHSEEVVTEAVAPTCSEDGYTAGVRCVNCGYMFEGEVIPATGHDYSSVTTSEANCCEDGVTTYTCATCGDTYTETIESDPDAHDMSAWEIITEPTCNTEGSKVRKCSVCGYIPSSRIILDEDTYPESAHSYPSNADLDYYFSYEGAEALYLTFSEDTHFESGYDYLHIYDGDGNLIGTYSDDSLAGVTITVPGDSVYMNLTSDGSYTYYGFSIDLIEADMPYDSDNYEVIPATGEHDYVSATTREATCSREGEITYTCADCGHSYTESTEKTAHTEEAMPEREATCSRTGSRGGKRCSVCEEITEAPEETPTTDHTPGEWQVMLEATADTDGMKMRCCTVCGAETERATIPAGTAPDGKPLGYLGDANNDGKVTAADARLILRHSAKIELLPETVHHLADINSDGKINASDARIALRMASKLEGLFLYGSGGFHVHEYETTIDAEATCTTDGKETKTCKICGETKTSTIAASGHAWTEATCSAPKTCTVCGTTEGSPSGHNYGSGSCVEPSTCTICGATTGAGGYHYSDSKFKCTKCGKNLSAFTDSFLQVSEWLNYAVEYQGLMIDNYEYRDYYDVVAYAIESTVYLKAILDECAPHPELATYASYIRKAYNKMYNALNSMTDSNGNIRTTQSNAMTLLTAIDFDNETYAIEEWGRIYDNTFAHLSN